ncbi:MAG: protein-glutamate O-methyltransferase CheR [Anaerolineae bacterium]|nr:protein-glutamate O-methyltransferase CheR [Anaerolineae bacterium]
MEEREYNFIKYKVRKLLDVDLNAYKAPQVQRRLRTYLLRSGYPNWPTFFRAIQDDPKALSKLRDYLTINVSSFFRDTEKFAYLRDSILPELLRTNPRLRVWSAGCSLGHEPYSLAIMLSEMTGPYRVHFILATDIDNSALDYARAGGPYEADKVANIPSNLLSRYFRVTAEGEYKVIEHIQRKITFQSHNLLSDPFPENIDLLVCRNVVIYFEQDVKTQLYRQFSDALRPGGILFVGGSEVLSNAAALGFESAGISFYRRKV